MRRRFGPRSTENNPKETGPSRLCREERWITNSEEIILRYREARSLKRAGVRELRAIKTELQRHSGNHHRTSCSYIAQVLRRAGTRVEYGNHLGGSATEDGYARRLKGLAKFRDLRCTLDSIRHLDAIYREYREASDRVGTCIVRESVARAKRRAESTALNPRLSLDKRREKQEIARWCRVWLEVPDLFFDWLEMRRQSDEFQKLFARRNGRPPKRA
jgi:hypothetical protein